MWKGNWANSNSSNTALHNSNSNSSNNSKSNNARSYSPASQSRRRPQLTPRSSSLNLRISSSSSQTSLPASQRQGTSNSGYRRRDSFSAQRPVGLKDPLDVLAAILGTEIPKAVMSSSLPNEKIPGSVNVPDKPGDVVEFNGLSLEEFIVDNSQQQPHTHKRTNSANSIEEYEKEKDKFSDLHKSIKACDEILKSVEAYLSSFQTDLGLVSAEIETLQTRSQALNGKLENRKTVEKILGPIIEDIAVPPHLVRKIADGEVNDSWIAALQEVGQKIKAVESRDPAKIKAIQDVKPELERLTNKAIERIREYFVTRIKALRMPNVNAQHIQQHGFLRMKELFNFMATHHKPLADEIAQAYTNTMRWYFLSHFQRYHRALEKMKLHIMDKSDLVGHEESTRRNVLITSVKATSISIHDPYNLGRRIETLENRQHPPIRAQTVDEDKSPHYIEVPFRHFNFALIENASVEYTFITEFFSYKSYEQASQMFHQIYDPTYNLAQSYTKALVENSMDALGILLCVRLNQQFAFELQRRRVPIGDSYINATNMLLWPRFQIIMDSQSESIRKLSSSGTGSFMTGSDGQKNSTAPHLLTQKFGQFMHSILALSADAGDDEPTANSLGRLRGEFENFLTKIGNSMNDGRKKERFLNNNYSLIFTIISDTKGKLAIEQKEHFQSLKRSLGDQQLR